ncbi:MAG: hypothetical protein AUJ52_14835 [Elusimicrobia bacterium CG1_02_63_36]|nr:MAG: hypothetical protein AUJ52_14835 [Elusimicrobia bacterium CG1_02_63_36]PIP81919.1 MAG: hypothetical protein COR54_17645 [Elusimicrobia bacterium CG22_combo_CG10-13_8_21_14_all_63_91]PJA18699.1 MAG: hypothetical protein COX66_00335 [Elusimicrobia bacterium CG_4_10_14_0_2_um_filter_63_34]PJB24970.1 MAG: hypothetical protein CO113_11050 [Elusimicrobia bacterium CG_4_9_14_3_um_filter_62_55]
MSPTATLVSPEAPLEWVSANEPQEDSRTLQYRDLIGEIRPDVHPIAVEKPYHLWGEISSAEGRLYLREALQLNVQRSDAEWFVEIPDLELFGHGDSLEAAKQDLVEFIVHDYFVYTRTPDNELSRGALDLKQQYRGFVEDAVYTA